MVNFDKTTVKKRTFIAGSRFLTMLKWLLIGAAIGLIVGAVSTAFSFCLSYVTGLRSKYPYIVYGLPIGGLAIVGLYKLIMRKDNGTNGIITSIYGDPDVPAKTAPLIFAGTTITHLFGGSAGREGAALQLGGSLGCLLGRIFKVNKYDRKIMLMAGMSAAFSALFGTPMAAAIFALEAAAVGSVYVASLLPCVVASIVACQFSASMGISPENFPLTDIPQFGPVNALKIILLAVLTSFVSILFCVIMKYTKKYLEKWFKNPFIRVIAASAVFLLITTLIGGNDYYGAGMQVIERAVIEGEAVWYAFILKMFLTAIIMGSGFKGGEIVPAFFVGATFGCVFGQIMGISPGLCAAMGMTAMFCGITNCPIASMLISFELFGFECVPFIAITVAVSFVASGYTGIYSSQRFMYSKYRPKYKDYDKG